MITKAFQAVNSSFVLKTMKKFPFLLLPLFLALNFNARAQDFLYTEYKYWKGLEVIFLPSRYDSFYAYGDNRVPTPTIPAQQFQGRTGTVVAVQETTLNFVFRLNDTGEFIETGTSAGCPSVALKRDFESAKKLYVGKVLYPKGTALHYYEEHLKAKQYEPLTVIAIDYSDNPERPIKLILQGKSATTSFAINPSGTGLPYYRNKEYRLDAFFLTENPKLKYKWPASIWKNIENQEASLGMTKQQAKMSWGEPRDINTTIGSFGTHEQWVYEGGYLYFDNGRLSAIQN